MKHLLQPTDARLRDTLDCSVSAVAVLVDGDEAALRYALLAEHLLPGARLVIMVFDQTVGEQLACAVLNCHVTSPADCAIPSIIGARLGDVIAAVEMTGRTTRVVRHDGAGEAVTGLLLTVFPDWTLSVLFPHEPGIRALYGATRIVATAGFQSPAG